MIDVMPRIHTYLIQKCRTLVRIADRLRFGHGLLAFEWLWPTMRRIGAKRIRK